MDFAALAHQCAPEVAYSTLAAIVHTESAGNPWALNVNIRSAANGRQRLARQPASREEATRWARWLVREGYNVDIGLMQVNSVHLARLGLDVGQLFDPCVNLRAGSIVLREFYARARQVHGDGGHGVLAALSGYNTGSLSAGLRNGYVAKVVGQPPARASAQTVIRPFVPHPPAARDEDAAATRAARESPTAIAMPASR